MATKSLSSSGGDLRRVPFEPTPIQKKFMLSTAKEVLLSGSFGAGKSRIGCEKGYWLNCKYPGSRGLIVRKSLKDVKASTINQTLLEQVIPPSHIPDKGGHTKRDNIIRHYTGQVDPTGDPVMGEIYYYGVRGGDSARDDHLPEKIGSTEFSWIFVDEGTELKQGEWNQLLGRLRYDGKTQNGFVFSVPFRQIFTATNPDSPNHWMYEYFIDPGGSDREYFQMNLFDNPHLPEDYVQSLTNNLSGMYYERYVEGKWVGAQGMVYDEYEPDKHLLAWDELPEAKVWEYHGEEEYDNGDKSVYVTPPPDWRIYRAIDFGYRNPFVCQWWARSPDDDLVLFREIYESELLVEDAAKRIKALDPNDRDIDMSVADHDAESADVLHRQGVGTSPAKKDVEAGIQAVKTNLMPDDRGKPSLYFMMDARAHKPDTQLHLNDRPLKTVDEIYSYTWKKKDGEWTEEPEKENDHGMDATRYIVHTLFGGPVLSTSDMEDWERIMNEGVF